MDLKGRLRAAVEIAKSKGYEVKAAGGGWFVVGPDKKNSKVMGLSTIVAYVDKLPALKEE